MTIFGDSLEGLPTDSQINRKKFDITAFGPAIFGKSHEITQKLLEESGQLKDLSHQPLAEQVRGFVFQKNNRQLYVKRAIDYLKEKKPAIDTKYDLVLIGAGIHSALFSYVLI